MRKTLGFALVFVLLVPAVAATAGSSSGEYRDDFKNVSYSGNDGSLTWSGSWWDSEDGDPYEGTIHVDDGLCSGNRCLHFDGQGLELEGIYIKRKADLSVFEAADWCFDLEIANVLPLTDAILWIEVSTNGGSNWTTIDTYPLLTSQGYHHPSYDMSDFLRENTYIRYRMTGLLSGEVYIDNVEIKGEFGGSSTTSTTSTTSTSTTSTTQPTTTTTKAPTTTTTEQTTTTSTSGETTTTERRSETTTTTTGEDESTTTTVVAAVPPPPTEPPFESGIREPGAGLMADYSGGMMGDMGETQVLSADVSADFSMAVEVFESAKVWIAVLALMIAVAVVSGMDTRRTKRQGV